MLKQGIVQVYTGPSQQMNFAHLGLCLRAAGQGLRTCLIRLSSHPFIEAEDRALSYLKPMVAVDRMVWNGEAPGKVLAEDTREVRTSLEHIHEVVVKGGFDIVILEEINPLLDKSIIPVDFIRDLITARPGSVELILTGKNAPEYIIDRAELVTEIVQHKGEEESWAIDGSSDEGCIGVVTGDGKGKTTYCLGRAMLVAANGFPASILQFIKSPQPYGEVLAIGKFPNLKIQTMGKGFIFGPKPSEDHIIAAKEAWNECLREVFSGGYRLIVLDEINIATHLGLLLPETVREMLHSKPRNLEVLMSGRGAHSEMKEQASAVFEMREIKHPFHQGIQARKGIEY
ncbi:MAG: cob(I)yrinic acid a,c-diamide adenosyltransferase [Thermodesulfobacteriota bacterium]